MCSTGKGWLIEMSAQAGTQKFEDQAAQVAAYEPMNANYPSKEGEK